MTKNDPRRKVLGSLHHYQHGNFLHFLPRAEYVCENQNTWRIILPYISRTVALSTKVHGTKVVGLGTLHRGFVIFSFLSLKVKKIQHDENQTSLLSTQITEEVQTLFMDRF